MELVEMLVDMSAAAKPRQIRYDVQSMINGELLGLPALVTTPGQVATIETGREYLEVNGDEIVRTMVGTTMEIQGELYGFGEQSVVNYTHISPPSEAALARYQDTGKLADLNLEAFEIIDHGILKRAEERFRDENHSAVFGPGGEVNLILTSRRIDATGRSVPGPMAVRDPGDDHGD